MVESENKKTGGRWCTECSSDPAINGGVLTVVLLPHTMSSQDLCVI